MSPRGTTSRAPIAPSGGLSFVTAWAEALDAPRREVHASVLADPVFCCASCEAEIRGHATFHVGLAFCCAGCVAGGPCTCSYDSAPSAGECPQRLEGHQPGPLMRRGLARETDLTRARRIEDDDGDS